MTVIDYATGEVTHLTEAEARRLTERIRTVGTARASLVDRIASQPWKVFPAITPRQGDVQHGNHLYLMQAGDSGPVKIGRANDPERRARELQPGCAERINIRAILPTRGAEERALHSRFASLRLVGEWFSPHPDIFEWFGVSR